MYSIALALMAGANAVAIADIVNAHNSGSIASTEDAIRYTATGISGPTSTAAPLGYLGTNSLPITNSFNLSALPTSTSTTADLSLTDFDPFAPITDGGPGFTTSFDIIPAGSPTEIYFSDNTLTDLGPTTINWTYSTSSPYESGGDDSDSDSDSDDDNPIDSDLPYRKEFAFQFGSSSDDQLEVQVDAANAPAFSEGNMLLSAPEKNSQRVSKNRKSSKNNKNKSRGADSGNIAFNPRNLIQNFDTHQDDAVWITRYAPPSTTTLAPPAASTATATTTVSASPVTSFSTVTNTITSTTTSTTTQAVYVTVPVSAGSSASIPTITVTNTATVTLPVSNLDESSIASASSSDDPCAQSYTLGYIDGADWGYQYGYNDGSHGMYFRPPRFATGSYPTAPEPTLAPTEVEPTPSAEPTLSQPYSQQYSTISYYVPYGGSPYQYGPYGQYQPQPEPYGAPYGEPYSSSAASASQPAPPPAPQVVPIRQQPRVEEVDSECSQNAPEFVQQAAANASER